MSRPSLFFAEQHKAQLTNKGTPREVEKRRGKEGGRSAALVLS